MITPDRQTKSKTDWIGWMLFADLYKALRLTLTYLFSKGVTMHYPDKEKWQTYPRHRGHPYLTKDEQGDIKCVACELCARICPCNCITVVPFEDEKEERRPFKFELDSRRCMYCGLCEDACPEQAIALGSYFEYSSFDDKDMVLNKEQLLALPGKNTTGGYVVAAELKPAVRVEIKNQQKPGMDWWKNISRH